MNDCVLWTGAVKADGYGKRKVGGVDYLAHRYAYEQAVGPIPSGMQLHHTCGERLCLNPAHMRPITVAEHAALHRRMEGLRLTDSEVAQIRQRAATETHAALAREFGVTPSYIGQLARLKWRV